MPSTVLDQLDTYGPDRCPQLTYEQATAYTSQLARSHYENFTVVSWFLPRRLRDDFRHVYAFCRWADDLGDETGDCQRSIELLNWWSREVDACYAGKPRHPVFVALTPTIEKHNIPRKPFDDLIAAFLQDQIVVRYDTFDQVVDYCTRSADPVGRLVLYLCGYRDDERHRLSDATCTALQLANFWQDVRRDVLERDRVYLPREVAQRHGLDIDAMVTAITAHEKQGVLPDPAMIEAYRGTIGELVDRTWPMFTRGRGLLPMLDADVRVDIDLFTMGGEAILKLIERQDYNTVLHRPSLSKSAKVTLMLRAMTGKLMAGLGMTRPARVEAA
jgi:squalene synthase HpnC